MALRKLQAEVVLGSSLIPKLNDCFLFEFQRGPPIYLVTYIATWGVKQVLFGSALILNKNSALPPSTWFNPALFQDTHAKRFKIKLVL